MTTAKCGTPGKRHLPVQREYSDPVVCLRMRGRRQKRGFGKVEPPRQSLHFIHRQDVGTDDNRQRITRKRPCAEDIDHMDGKVMISLFQFGSIGDGGAGGWHFSSARQAV